MVLLNRVHYRVRTWCWRKPCSSFLRFVTENYFRLKKRLCTEDISLSLLFLNTLLMREFKIHQWWTTFKKGENFNLLQIEMAKNFLYPISNQSKLWRNPSYLIQYIEVPIHQSLGKNVIATSAKKVYINTTGPLQGVQESLNLYCKGSTIL